MTEDEANQEEFNKADFDKKLELIRNIMDVVIGAETVGARINPILTPKNPKTTSILTRGEIDECRALIAFAQLEPEETYPALDFVFEKLSLNLSIDGRGIEYGIELGKALTQRDSSTKYVESPTKPTQGMKDK